MSVNHDMDGMQDKNVVYPNTTCALPPLTKCGYEVLKKACGHEQQNCKLLLQHRILEVDKSKSEPQSPSYLETFCLAT